MRRNVAVRCPSGIHHHNLLPPEANHATDTCGTIRTVQRENVLPADMWLLWLCLPGRHHVAAIVLLPNARRTGLLLPRVSTRISRQRLEHAGSDTPRASYRRAHLKEFRHPRRVPGREGALAGRKGTYCRRNLFSAAPGRSMMEDYTGTVSPGLSARRDVMRFASLVDVSAAGFTALPARFSRPCLGLGRWPGASFGFQRGARRSAMARPADGVSAI